MANIYFEKDRKDSKKVVFFEDGAIFVLDRKSKFFNQDISWLKDYKVSPLVKRRKINSRFGIFNPDDAILVPQRGLELEREFVREGLIVTNSLKEIYSKEEGIELEKFWGTILNPYYIKGVAASSYSLEDLEKVYPDFTELYLPKQIRVKLENCNIRIKNKEKLISCFNPLCIGSGV